MSRHYCIYSYHWDINSKKIADETYIQFLRSSRAHPKICCVSFPSYFLIYIFYDLIASKMNIMMYSLGMEQGLSFTIWYMNWKTWNVNGNLLSWHIYTSFTPYSLNLNHTYIFRNYYNIHQSRLWNRLLNVCSILFYVRKTSSKRVQFL